MQHPQLQVISRTVVGSHKLRQLRDTGQIPAVVYGHVTAAKNITAPRQAFLKVYRQAGASTLVDLVVDGNPPIPALIQEVQVDPVTNDLLHVDFHQVNLKEKITARIRLTFTGTARAVKEAGGVLMTNLSELEVTCLPQDLVSEIPVDIAILKTFNDYIHVEDLQLPPGLTPRLGPKEVVAHVMAPRSEEELQALDQQPVTPTAAAEVPVAGQVQQEAETSPAAATPENVPGKTGKT